MVKTLTDIVLTVGGFQLYLLAAVVLTQNSSRLIPKGFFAAFLLTKAFLITRWFSYRFDILSVNESPVFYLVSTCGFFLLAPLLYLYIKALCFKDFRLRPTLLLHGIPIVLLLVWSAARLSCLNTEINPETGFLTRFVVLRYWDLFWSLNFIQIALYILAMLRTVRSYQSGLREIYSTVEGINLSWLVTLIAVIGLHWLFVVSRATLALLNVNAGLLIELLDLFSITIFLVFTTVLVIRGLGRIRLFAGISAKPKYASSKLTEPAIEIQAGRVRELMELKKPYLMPSLTIDDLATELSIPSWQLSQVINRAFNQNFFSFVNSYRVEEAKARLSDPASNRFTVLQILLEVGFNSKSAFNEAFRRHAGMTPREFKKASQP